MIIIDASIVKEQEVAMSKYAQRGRKVESKKNNSLPIFYAILGIVALVGIIFIALILRGNVITEPDPKPTTVAVNLEGLPSKGEASAPVTIVEYSDFQCPACAEVALGLMPHIEETYIKTGKVRFFFHDFPLPGHSNAIPASEAAHCAGDQNAFWQ